MKYIRTKEGRILKGSNYGFGVGMPYKNYDVKVADALEELMDEFVLVNGYRFRKPKTATELNKDIYEMASFYNSEDDIIYGAIWTIGEHDEPILKPMAKLKGISPNCEIDWELL